MSSSGTLRSGGVGQALGFYPELEKRSAEVATPRSNAWKQYRHPETGTRSVHPKAEPFTPREGRPKVPEVHVEDLMTSDKSAVSGLVQTILDQRESVYKSRSNERLGQSPRMNYELPDHLTPRNTAFKGFGVSSDRSVDAKKVIFGAFSNVDPEDDVKSQRFPEAWKKPQVRGRPRGVDFEEQRIDTAKYVFGRVDPNRDWEGAAKCIAPGKMEVPKEPFICKTVADMKASSPHHGHVLGMSKAPLGSLDPQFRFGKASPRKTDSVKSCVYDYKSPPAGSTSVGIDDVGVSVRRARGKLPAEVLEDEAAGKVFGMPTVRTDVAAPKNRRTDDNANFGDDTNTISLLRDGLMLETKPLFLTPYPREQLRGILERCGGLFEAVLSDDALFDSIWADAVPETRRLVLGLPKSVQVQVLNRGASIPENCASVEAFRVLCEQRSV